MAKTLVKSSGEKFATGMLIALVFLSLLSPLWVFSDLLFPFVTSKAFMFRMFIELALPFYVYLLVLKKEYRPKFNNPLFLSLLIFLAANVLAAFFGGNPSRSFWGNYERMGGVYYLIHLVLLSLYTVLLSQARSKYIKWVLYSGLGIAGVIALNGLSGFLGGPILTRDPSLPSRVSSTFGNPIFLASFLVIPVFLAAFFALQEETAFRRRTFWALGALFLLGIFLSATRGALVGLAAGILPAAAVYVILQPRKKIKMYGGGAILAVVLLLGAVFVMHSSLPQNRLTRIFNLSDGNSKARLIQWQVALKGVVDDPILGVGPENYYIVGNKYYNPEIIKYDPTWFDKPHNYVLEVLITTGFVGFAAYLALNFFVAWSFYKSFRAGLIGLGQMCLLLAGLLSYFAQNMFVFDTIPASIMFYLFVGFGLFLWTESAASEDSTKPLLTKNGLANFGLVLSGALALYLFFITNWVPFKAAKDVNYGYVYTGLDPAKALEYFHSAVNSTFNFDRQETALRFSNFPGPAFRSGKIDPKIAIEAGQEALSYQKQVAEEVKNDPVAWQNLAGDYYTLSVIQGKPIDPNSEQAALTAMQLVPRRFEPQKFLLQIYIAQEDWQKAKAMVQKMQGQFPEGSYTQYVAWMNALIDHNLGQDSRALAEAAELKEKNYSPQDPVAIGWVLQHYEDTKDYGKLLEWCQAEAEWFPEDPEARLNLARAYFKVNRFSEAKAIAEKLVAEQAPNQATAQALLNLIPNK